MAQTFTRTYFLIFALLFAGFATGCASTGSGSTTSTLSSAAPAKLSKTPLSTDALVVVRYPAAVDDAAKRQYYKAFRSKAIGGTVGTKGSEVDSDQVADSVIMKSSYFAMSLYDQLSKKLPANTVLLSPHIINEGADGKLTSSPMASTETVPGAIKVDFATYSFPNPDKMMKKQPVTFGDLITPLITVSTDHRARPGTHGLIMASEPISKAVYSQAKDSADASFSAIQSGTFEAAPQPLHMVAHLNGESASLPATHALGKAARSKNSVAIYPLEKLRLSKTSMANLAQGGSSDPLAAPFSEKVANHIIAMLNDTDLTKAGMVSRASAIARYDENLAPFALSGETSADFKARNRLSNALISQERKVLAAQSQKIYNATYAGEPGVQMREMMAAEYKLIEDRREIAKQQNMATTASILGAIAAVGVASSGGGDSNTNAVLSRMITNMTALAVQKSIALNKQSKAMGSNFRLAMAPVLAEQVDVQVDLLDGSETISAASFAELQDKMQSAYSRKVRAMDQVASECAFNDPSGASGRWLGECSSGAASGKGIGTVRLANGTNVEYYGSAENGLAQGVGYLVVHDSKTPYSLEGNFVSGEANGPMHVIKSGNSETLRQYENGKDVGNVSSGFNAPRLHKTPLAAAQIPAS